MSDLAAADVQSIIEDTSGAGTPYVLVDTAGNEYPVIGTLGDIGSLVDPLTGAAIQGRSIEATVTMQTIKAAAGEIPARGWMVRITEKDGKQTALYVQRNEVDRTIGLCLLTLGKNLNDKEKDTENGE